MLLAIMIRSRNWFVCLLRNNANETEFLSLSVFLNTPNGLNIEDEVISQIRLSEPDEDEDD